MGSSQFEYTTVKWLCPNTVSLWDPFTQTKERVMKFEKFVAENDVKRRQARKKFEDAREQNMLKQRELEDLTEQLKQLRARWERMKALMWRYHFLSHLFHLCYHISIHSHQVLKERMAKYKIYEDYLMKTLDYFPSCEFKTDCLHGPALFILMSYLYTVCNPFQLTLTMGLTLWLCPLFGAMRPCPSPTKSFCSVYGVWRKRLSRASDNCRPWSRNTA